jgi:hypothetical protein
MHAEWICETICGFVPDRKIAASLINITVKRKNPMETLKIKREIVAEFMKSPLYLTIPLDKRLGIIKFFSHPTVYSSCDLYKPKRIGNRDLRPASLD